METMILHLGDLDDAVKGGVIYVTIGDAAFPEEGWYDLAGADFEIWLPRLISFAQEHADTCVLRFMDGPAVMNLVRQSDGSIYASFLWDQKVKIPKTEIDFCAFLKSVYKCVRQYNRVLHERSMPIRFESELSIIRAILNYQL